MCLCVNILGRKEAHDAYTLNFCALNRARGRSLVCSLLAQCTSSLWSWDDLQHQITCPWWSVQECNCSTSEEEGIPQGRLTYLVWGQRVVNETLPQHQSRSSDIFWYWINCKWIVSSFFKKNLVYVYVCAFSNVPGSQNRALDIFQLWMQIVSAAQCRC